MNTLRDLLQQLDTLSHDELEVVRRHIEERQQHTKSAAERMAAIDAAIEAFNEDLSPEMLDKILWAMNVEFVNPVDLERLREEMGDES